MKDDTGDKVAPKHDVVDKEMEPAESGDKDDGVEAKPGNDKVDGEDKADDKEGDSDDEEKPLIEAKGNWLTDNMDQEDKK